MIRRLFAPSFLDVNVAELHESGWAAPFLVLGVPGAVVLQGDAPALGSAGELGIADYFFAAELHRQPITLHLDFKRVPFAARLVRVLLGSNARANGCRHPWIGAVAPDLARADRP